MTHSVIQALGRNVGTCSRDITEPPHTRVTFCPESSRVSACTAGGRTTLPWCGLDVAVMASKQQVLDGLDGPMRVACASRAVIQASAVASSSPEPISRFRVAAWRASSMRVGSARRATAPMVRPGP
jgi:hypothetical protein